MQYRMIRKEQYVYIEHDLTNSEDAPVDFFLI